MRGRRINRYTAGTTNIDSSGAVTIPPTIGAAMRCITSEPVPPPNMMGTRPPMITAPLLSMFAIPAAYLLMRRPREAKARRWAFWSSGRETA